MTPGNRNAAVDTFLDALEHARKPEIHRLREAILGCDPAIIETVKWNAPNFRYGGEDRVTFRLRPRDQVQIIFHRGARVRDDQDTFHVDDPAGLLEWLAADRAVVTLADAADTDANLLAVTELVRRWIRA